MEPDSRLLSAELSECLHEAVGDLPEVERMLVRLHVLEDWPMDFLSASLSRSREHCEATLQVALARLRLRLGAVFS